MKMNSIIVLALALLVASPTQLLSQKQSRNNAQHGQSKAEIWKVIAPYFTPPVNIQDQLGSYRSPLKFYDGSTVSTKQDWTKRNEEIRNRWHQLMGEWPA